MDRDTRPRSIVGAVLSIALAGLSGTGCSFLFHSDASQCSSDSDCVARGFANTSCEVSTGTCVPRISSSDGGTEGGRDGGQENEAGKTDGGKSCHKSSECPSHTASFGQVQTACDVDTNTCVDLTSEECPYVIGDTTNDNAPPIFIGAFATIPNSGPMNHPSFLNYELALTELGNNGDGISIGSGLRTPVAVVCSDESDPNVVMPHLVNDVHIAVLVAALNTTTLLTTFANVNGGDASAPSVLFINPFGSDDLFASIKNDLLWSLLGQPTDVTQAYEAFFPRVEAYVRNLQNLTAPDGGAPVPLRIASVTSASADTQQLSASVQKAMGWNTSDANYIDVTLKFSSLNAGYTLSEGTTEASTAAQTLADFKPNVVVSFGSEEFVDVIEDLDGFDWNQIKPAIPKPFYLLAPYNVGSPTLLSWIGSDDTKRVRLAGLNFASAPTNDPVLSAYTNNFVMQFPQAASNATDYNNYYDAMYFAVYSLAAAPNVSPLTGTAAGNGMLDITYTSPPGTSVDMGAASIATVESTLTLPGTLSRISLNGTLGPSDFNQKTGARVGQGDVYCVSRYPEDAGVDDAGNTLALQPFYVDDVLRLDPDGGATTDAGVPGLEGDFSCYDGMAPP